MKTYHSVKEYIASFPADIQITLNKMRDIVCKYVPDAQEYIGYGMPGYKLGGKPLIYFAAFKQHIGVYPTPSGVEAFAGELAEYKKAKGSIQFPLVEAFPFDLFTKIVQYLVKELSS